jgi:hypothetical protein
MTIYLTEAFTSCLEDKFRALTALVDALKQWDTSLTVLARAPLFSSSIEPLHQLYTRMQVGTHCNKVEWCYEWFIGNGKLSDAICLLDKVASDLGFIDPYITKITEEK